MVKVTLAIIYIATAGIAWIGFEEVEYLKSQLANMKHLYSTHSHGLTHQHYHELANKDHSHDNDHDHGYEYAKTLHKHPHAHSYAEYDHEHSSLERQIRSNSSELSSLRMALSDHTQWSSNHHKHD